MNQNHHSAHYVYDEPESEITCRGCHTELQQCVCARPSPHRSHRSLLLNTEQGETFLLAYIPIKRVWSPVSPLLNLIR